MAALLIRKAPAQAVALPAIHHFSVQTSVLVPDSGGAYLGSINRSRADGRGRSGWGPRRIERRAGTVVASGAMVHATVIDLAELDAQVLTAARASGGAAAEPPIALGGRVGARSMPVASVAAIKERQAVGAAAEEAAAAAMFQRAAAYEAAGEYSLARNYYRVAQRKSHGRVAVQAAARLASLPPATSRRR